MVRNLDFLLNTEASKHHAPFKPLQCNREIEQCPWAFQLRNWERGCGCFVEMGEYGYKAGAVEGGGLPVNRGSGMDSGEAKEWPGFKDRRLPPPHRENVRSPWYSGSLCI